MMSLIMTLIRVLSESGLVMLNIAAGRVGSGQ